jgi:hypothetical protein
MVLVLKRRSDLPVEVSYSPVTQYVIGTNEDSSFPLL